MAILIVDDEKPIRLALRDILEYENYIVHEATDGLDAISKLSEYDGEIEVILVDLRMPNMGGFELIQYLTINYHQVVGIIVVSAFSNSENIKKFFRKKDESKFIIKHDFIAKAPDLQKLLESIKQAVKAVKVRKQKLGIDSQGVILDKINNVNSGLVEINNLIKKLNNGLDKEGIRQSIWKEYFNKELANYNIRIGEVEHNIDETKEFLKHLISKASENNIQILLWQKSVDKELKNQGLYLINLNDKLHIIKDCVTSIEKDLSDNKGHIGLFKKIGSDLLSSLIIGLAILALFYLGVADLIKKILGL